MCSKLLMSKSATTTVANLSTEMGGRDERRENAVRDWSVERSKGPRTEMNNLDQETYFHPYRVGRVEDACVHNDDRTRRWKSRRWSV